jgi:hypothetical protein
MTVNLNQVAITGNLTREPSLVTLPSGHYADLGVMPMWGRLSFVGGVMVVGWSA